MLAPLKRLYPEFPPVRPQRVRLAMVGLGSVAFILGYVDPLSLERCLRRRGCGMMPRYNAKDLFMDTLTRLMVSLLGGTRKESKRAAQAHLKKLRTTNPEAAAEFEKAWDLSQKICPEIPSFLGTCEKGGRLARVYSTRGVSALALSHHHLPHPSTFLRIPHDVGGSGKDFTDATWMHDDASIRLVDGLAVLYVHEDGSCVFDHAPEVLGLTLTSPDGGPGSKEKKS